MAMYEYDIETLVSRGFTVYEEFAIALRSDGRMFVERGLTTPCNSPIPTCGGGVSTHREISGGGLTTPLVVNTNDDGEEPVVVWSEWDTVLLGVPDRVIG